MEDSHTDGSGSMHAQQKQQWELKDAIGPAGAMDPALRETGVSNSKSWPREAEKEQRNHTVAVRTVWFWAYVGYPWDIPWGLPEIILFGDKHSSQEAGYLQPAGVGQEPGKH